MDRPWSRLCRRRSWLAGPLIGVLVVVPFLTPASGWPAGQRQQLRQRLRLLERRALEHDRKGEDAAAAGMFQEMLTLCRKLHPAKEYPRGHPDLARGMDQLGVVLLRQGEVGKSAAYLHKALTMREKLYPGRTHPRGHIDRARSLTHVAGLLRARGEHARAWRYHEEALAMYRKLYPRGHPDQAACLVGMGAVLEELGEHARALHALEQALAMRRQLYPPERYPRGHPDLAESLHALGHFLLDRGASAKAVAHLREARTIYQDLFERFALEASEIERLHFAARLPTCAHCLLSGSTHPDRTVGPVYPWLWRHKAARLRLLQGRRLTVSATMERKTQQLSDRLRATRVELDRLAPRPGHADPASRPRVQELTVEKERLERQIARRSVAFPLSWEQDRLRPEHLARTLPPHTVFIDLVRYRRLHWQDKAPDKSSAGAAMHYAAFLLSRDQPVRRIDLGPAQPLDAVVTAWRRELLEEKGAASAAALTLRRQLWEPLARQFPANTETVWLAPDGTLTALPWAALPGSKPGTVLLEERALALVPHGVFLLERLTGSPVQADKGGLLLAVGGVDFGRGTADERSPADETRTARAPSLGGKGLVWKPLPGSDQERQRVVELAEKTGRAARSWSGPQASAAQVLLDLPRARWAHLATHGFFANHSFRPARSLDEKTFTRARRGERHPLRLVLAGANESGAERGILTAEAIAGQDLDNLELVVLSACAMGPGEGDGDAGVFGLQQAFHLAGCRDVLASLWKVEDQASAALMGLFYHHLWVGKRSPLEAIRQAQLHLYRHPEDIANLARRRGVDFAREGPLPGKGTTPPSDKRSPPRHWAGFILSGPGL